jgi:hypothetical protein
MAFGTDYNLDSGLRQNDGIGMAGSPYLVQVRLASAHSNT